MYPPPPHYLSALLNSIMEAYKSGRGRIVVRGKTEIETIDEKSKRAAIIIKEVCVKFFVFGAVSDISTVVCSFGKSLYLLSSTKA